MYCAFRIYEGLADGTNMYNRKCSSRFLFSKIEKHVGNVWNETDDYNSQYFFNVYIVLVDRLDTTDGMT